MVLIASVCLGGCVSLAPSYRQPVPPVASAWHDAGDTGPQTALVGWRSFFLDPRLRRVIERALTDNRDLRIAILGVEKSRAAYRVQRAAQFPSIATIASEVATRTPASLAGTTAGTASTSHADTFDVGFSAFELDMFGRVRSLKDEALERYLGSEETRRAAQLSLVADVAQDWLAVAANSRLLALAQAMERSEEDTMSLVMRKQALGAASGLDVAQAQASFQAMRAEVATYTAQVAQACDALDLVVGAPVADADLPDASVDAVSALDRLSAGVPSTVLVRRPDVLAAEHVLKASHADIGAARASFFPRITLTASAGSGSDQLSGLFKGGSGAWNLASGISLPIFDAGTNRANLDAAKVQAKIDLASYERTIQVAFREVADALATRATITQRLDAQQARVVAGRRSYDLALALYRQGRYSFLDTLTTRRTLYAAEQDQIATQLAAQASLVTLYKALGGGWTE
ncbi:MAG: Outer membrane protein OprM [Luteibacter sp.]|nr:MAG: Outer membrane protein OprM [Luteibacter sp.]